MIKVREMVSAEYKMNYNHSIDQNDQNKIL